MKIRIEVKVETFQKSSDKMGLLNGSDDMPIDPDSQFI